MNQPSAFQAQYPLSPKKFWKKICGRVILNFVEALILGIILGLVIAMLTIPSDGQAHVMALLSIAISFVGGFFIIFTILHAIYIRVYIKRYYYDCGEQFITIKKGVFAPTEIHVQYQKIQDVYVDQDIIDRILGLYDVHIASATITSGIEAHIDGVNVDVAEALKNIILEKIHNVSGNSNTPQTFVSQPQQPPQPSPIQLSQKISSETYPISSSWIWSAFIKAIGTSLIVIFIFGIPALIRINDFNSVPWIILLFVIVFLYQTIWYSIWKKNYYFEFLPDYILLRTGVISKQENHLPYKSIQNVLNAQGVFDRMFGLSTVVIQNAAIQMVSSSQGQSIVSDSGISLVWQPVAKAQELNDILNDIVSKINPQNSNNMMGL